MAQFYSNPENESDPWKLPDLEVWYKHPDPIDGSEGWYFWVCFPGCLPDTDPTGPYATEAQALENARQCYSDNF